MKKIFLLTVAFLCLIPFTSAFAYSSADFSKSILYLKKSNEVNYDFLTDGNVTNYQGIGKTSNVTYVLNKPYVIDGFAVSSPDLPNGVRLRLYDNNDVLLSETRLDSSLGTVSNNIYSFTYSVPIQNVYKVQLSNPSSSYNYTFGELAVFSSSYGVSPVTDLKETHTYNSATLSWTVPLDSTGTIIKKDGVQIADLPNTQSSYTVSNLNSESTYNFEVFAKYADNSFSAPKTISVTTDVMPADTTPPANVTNVIPIVSTSVATFSFDKPLDTDFSHLQIYRDGNLIADNYTSSTFEDLNLQPNTSYVYKFVSVDTSKNMSSGYVITVKTEMEIDSVAPSVPTDLNVSNGSGSAKITWKANTESDLAGYNVYLNGTKVNTTYVVANSYTFSNLENGTSYSIAVSAVDTSGNESALSPVMTAVPDAESMPIFKMDYDLKAVSDGTANWFESLWPILAFAVGITLAFIVAGRVKGLLIS